MQTRLTLFVICLLLALSVPAWGESGSPGKAAPAGPIKAGNYMRDPSKPMEMRKYLKELKQKQKAAAAKKAASQAGQAENPQTKGGTK